MRSVERGAVALLVLSWLAAWPLLPPRIEVYFGPASSPDGVYARWQFLLLQTVGAAVVIIGVRVVARSLESAVHVFAGRAGARPGPAAAVATTCVALAWAAQLWLAMGFGNRDATARSVLETAVAVAGIVGGLALGLWVSSRRAAD